VPLYGTGDFIIPAVGNGSNVSAIASQALSSAFTTDSGTNVLLLFPP
jgi:hypothetical protein